MKRPSPGLSGPFSRTCDMARSLLSHRHVTSERTTETGSATTDRGVAPPEWAGYPAEKRAWHRFPAGTDAAGESNHESSHGVPGGGPTRPSHLRLAFGGRHGQRLRPGRRRRRGPLLHGRLHPGDCARQDRERERLLRHHRRSGGGAHDRLQSRRLSGRAENGARHRRRGSAARSRPRARGGAGRGDRSGRRPGARRRSAGPALAQHARAEPHSVGRRVGPHAKRPDAPRRQQPLRLLERALRRKATTSISDRGSRSAAGSASSSRPTRRTDVTTST